MTNKYQDHLWVLPEDDANRQLVNGFVLNIDIDPCRLQVLAPARGWNNVFEGMQRHPSGLVACAYRHLVLMIDFDTQVALTA